MEPCGTCFISGSKYYFDLEEPLHSFQRHMLANVYNRAYDHFNIYDAKGLTWKLDGTETPFQWRSRLLLRFKMLFSPWVPVTYVWREPVEYSLDDLKAVYIKAVEMDDDILTQFVEADPLKKRIEQAQSFHELVEVYHWMGSDHTCEYEDEEE